MQKIQSMTPLELESWFRNAKLPQAPVTLFPGTTITDIEKFLESHLIPLRLAPNSPTSHTHIFRLMALKRYIESKS